MLIVENFVTLEPLSILLEPLICKMEVSKLNVYESYASMTQFK